MTTPPNPNPAAQTGPTPPPPSEFDAGLDALEGTDNPSLAAPPTQSTPDPTPTPEPKRDESTTPPPGTSKPEDTILGNDLQKFAQKPEPAKPADGVPAGPKALRDEYQKLKSEAESRAAKIAELERIIEQTKTTATEQAKAAMDARLKELESQYAKAQETLRAADYRLSDEYRDRYVKPEEEAWKAAADALAGVKIELPDGSEREITDADVSALAKMSERQAFEASIKMGQYGSLVLEHARRIRDLSQRRLAAVAEHSKRAEELNKAKAEGINSARKTWESGVETVLSRSADIIGIKPDDAEMKEVLDAGDKLARAAMLGEVPDGENRVQTLLQAQTMAGVRIKAFGALFLRAQRADAIIADLRAKLAMYEGGEPGIGGDTLRVADPGSRTSSNPEDEIDNIPGTEFPT